MIEHQPPTVARIVADQRGSAFFEYIIVVAFAALLVIAVFGPRIGASMTNEYTSQRASLYSATP